MCKNKLEVCTYSTVRFTLRFMNLFIEFSQVCECDAWIMDFGKILGIDASCPSVGRNMWRLITQWVQKIFEIEFEIFYRDIFFSNNNFLLHYYRPCPFIQILSRFSSNFILILYSCYPDFFETRFIQILSRLYPKFWKYLDRIWIKFFFTLSIFYPGFIQIF